MVARSHTGREDNNGGFGVDTLESDTQTAALEITTQTRRREGPKL